MNAIKSALLLVLLVAGGVGAWAQDGRGRGDPPIPDAGFWPTEKMLMRMIDRMTEDMGQRYEFDDDQLENARVVIKERFPAWMQNNRAHLQTLMNEYFEAILDGEPPAAGDVAEWAQRAMPLVDSFTGMVEGSTGELRKFMTEDQQIKLDGEMAAFRVGINFMSQRLGRWSEGGFDPETEWPRSPRHREAEMERERAVQAEMQAAQAREAAEAGLPPGDQVAPPDEMPPPGPGPGPAGAPGAPGSQPAPPPPAKVKAKPSQADEWTRYTEDFIRRYDLDEAQQSKAREFLKGALEERDSYLRRKKDDIDKAFKRVTEATSDEQRKEATKAYERLNAPLDRMFQRLKDRLDKLPTAKQRAAAVSATLEKSGKPPAGKPESAPAREPPPPKKGDTP